MSRIKKLPKPISKIAFASLALLWLSAAGLHPNCFARSQPHWPMVAADGRTDDRVTWGTLENGLRYALLPMGGDTKTASLRLVVDAGSAHESKDNQEVAHLLEHMAFKSALSLKGKSLFQVLSNEMIETNAHANASTLPEHTVYELDLIDANDVGLETALAFLSDLCGGLVFDKTVLEFEKRILVNEYYERDTKAVHDLAALYSSLFKDADESDLSLERRRQSVMRLELRDVESFWKSYYSPDNCVLIVTGNIDRDSIEKKVRSAFSAPSSKRTAVPPARETAMRKPSGNLQIIESESFAAQTHAFYISPPFNYYQSSEYAHAQKLVYLSHFAQCLVRPSHDFSDPPVYRLNDRILMDISDGGSPDLISTSIYALDKVIYKIGHTGFDRSDWERFKRRFNTYIATEDSGYRRYESSKGLANRLASSVLNHIPFRTLDQTYDIDKRILDAFSYEEANELGKTIFEPGNFHTITQLPEDYILNRNDLKKRVKAQRKSQKNARDFGDAYTPEWRKDLHRDSESRIESFQTSQFGSHEILRYTLNNGVRLNLVETNANPGTFRACLSIGNGRNEYDDMNPGAAMLAQSTLSIMKVGTSSNAPNLEQALVDIGMVEIEFGCDLDSLFIKAVGNSERDLQPFLLLLEYALKDAEIPPASLASSLRTFTYFGQELRTKDAGAISETLLFPHEHRLREMFNDLEIVYVPIARFMEWMTTTVKSDYLELTIVGDVKARDALRILRGSLGALPERERSLRPISEFPKAEIEDPFLKKGIYLSKSDRSFIRFFWPTNIENTPASFTFLGALSEVVSSQLYQTLREEDALIYSVNVEVVGDTTIPFSQGILINLSTRSDKAEALKDRVLQTMPTLAQTLSAEALDMSAQRRRSRIKVGQHFDSILLKLLDQSQGRPEFLRYYEEAMKDPLELNSQREAFLSALFDPANARVVILSPIKPKD